MAARFLFSLAIVVPLTLLARDVGDQGGTVEADNGLVRVVCTQDPRGVRESIFARSGTGWILVLEAGSPVRPDPALRVFGETNGLHWTDVRLLRPVADSTVILLRGSNGGLDLEKSICLPPRSSWVHVHVRCSTATPQRLQHLLSTYTFRPDGLTYATMRPLDFVFTPQLRPLATDVIGDHVFRAPALMMQEGGRFAALVPDIRTIDGATRVSRAGADLLLDTADAPLMSFGLLPWSRRAHVYYTHSDTHHVDLPAGSTGYGFFLFVRADAPVRQGYREVVRFHWDTWGRSWFDRDTGPQVEPFDRYIDRAWMQYLPQVAMDAEYRGVPVTLLRQSRLAWSNRMHAAADNDSWFNVWFNALRTAYGATLYARSTSDTMLQRRMSQVLNLALAAPRREGISPTIFYVDSSGGHWVADHWWGGIRRGEYLPMFHNAWTCYWLLRWLDLAPGRREEILSVTGAFAEFLIRHQQTSGVIPSWYHPGTLEPAPEFRDENAETAGAALFLAEFSFRTGSVRHRAAAERAMEYVFSAILPEQRWFDFETFFSCSRKPLGFYDRYTGQHPQNTLSIHQAAEACRLLQRITGNSAYLRRGEEILDYLCLYQQVWSPRWLSCELFGGFGVQNTDGEWSDSRQGYFAVTLVDFYEATGKREYFERGVAALRAMFSLFESPTSPRTAENYAHGAEDRLAGVTGLHWGTGSSVVSIHLIRARYGDAYVNLKDHWGAGIDGCRVSDLRIHGGTITLTLRDVVNTPRRVRLVCNQGGLPSYTLIVNGRSYGTCSAQRLGDGIEIAL